MKTPDVVPKTDSAKRLSKIGIAALAVTLVASGLLFSSEHLLDIGLRDGFYQHPNISSQIDVLFLIGGLLFIFGIFLGIISLVDKQYNRTFAIVWVILTPILSCVIAGRLIYLLLLTSSKV